MNDNVCPYCKGNPGLDCNSFGSAVPQPPSAPVGVEAIAAEIRASLGRGATVSTRRRWAVELEALAQQPAVDPRSTHRVWRGDDWQPCYCEATDDHRIGSEQPAAVDGVMSPQVAKDWLLELMGDHDFTLPTEAFDELVGALAAQPGGDRHG